MGKHVFVLAIIALILTLGCLQETPPQVVCTEDAKICPDGSSVGRIPPDCEFAPCPGTSETPPPQHYPKTPTPTLQPVCKDGEVKNSTCPDGVTVYTSENCVDGKWFTINYIRDPCSPLPTPDPQQKNMWVEIAPIQCLGNPWEQDWLKSHADNYSGYPKDREFEVIKDYYKRQGIVILDVKSRQKYEVVCLACTCPRGDALYLLVNAIDSEKMLALGYKASTGV